MAVQRRLPILSPCFTPPTQKTFIKLCRSKKISKHDEIPENVTVPLWSKSSQQPRPVEVSHWKVTTCRNCTVNIVLNFPCVQSLEISKIQPRTCYWAETMGGFPRRLVSVLSPMRFLRFPCVHSESNPRALKRPVSAGAIYPICLICTWKISHQLHWGKFWNSFKLCKTSPLEIKGNTFLIPVRERT